MIIASCLQIEYQIIKYKEKLSIYFSIACQIFVSNMKNTLLQNWWSNSLLDLYFSWRTCVIGYNRHTFSCFQHRYYYILTITLDISVLKCCVGQPSSLQNFRPSYIHVRTSQINSLEYGSPTFFCIFSLKHLFINSLHCI